MTMTQRSWKLTGLVATVVIVLSFPLSLILNRQSGDLKEPVAVFTGGNACIECHQKGVLEAEGFQVAEFEFRRGEEARG